MEYQNLEVDCPKCLLYLQNESIRCVGGSKIDFKYIGDATFQLCFDVAGYEKIMHIKKQDINKLAEKFTTISKLLDSLEE